VLSGTLSPDTGTVGSVGSGGSVRSVGSVGLWKRITSGRSEDEFGGKAEDNAGDGHGQCHGAGNVEEEEEDTAAREENGNEEQAIAWLAYGTAITYAVMLCQHERATELTEALQIASGGSETLFTSAFLPYQSLLLPLTIEQTVAIARAAADDIAGAAAFLPTLAPPQV
jgi:hypothetical protein